MATASPEILHSPRSGDAYNAHSYHTKVPADAIARLIERHLPQGGVVADAFCGSGSTGVGAAIAERSLPAGQRYDVVLGDLSPYATFIAQGLNEAPDEQAFDAAASQCLQAARERVGELWRTRHSDGRVGEVLYTVFSELLICPCCGGQSQFWERAVDLRSGQIHRLLTCDCGHSYRKDQAQRVIEATLDPFTGERIERPVREPVLISYAIDGQRHEKSPDSDDLALIRLIQRLPAPPACPRSRMMNTTGPWGDLYRGGYHEGITHVHHFYTWRNFLTLGHLWEEASRTTESDAVRLLISSYNLSHATLMSRLVFKRASSRPVLTGYQTGALYISSLPVEKNPLVGVERKQRALQRAFALVRHRRGKVEVRTGPGQGWRDLPVCVDYAFVDPPFGANIPYAEANFIAEAWLGRFTSQTAEATISQAQGKSAHDYSKLLRECFEALRERMSKDARMTVMFHSSSSEPWDALGDALEKAGFHTDGVLLLNKRQSSFKQVRAKDAVQGDLLIELTQRRRSAPRTGQDARDLTGWLQRQLELSEMPFDADVERALFSRYVAEHVALGMPLTTSAPKFYAALRQVAAAFTDPAPVS